MSIVATRIIWELLLFNDYPSSRELLDDLYVIQKWSMESIAEKLGIDKVVVRKELARLNIPIRPKGRPRFIHNIMSTVFSCATLASFTIIRKAIKLR